MVSSEIIAGLKTCELFDLLSSSEMQVLTTSIAGAWEMVAYQAGEHIFDQGELSSRLHIIVSGQVLLQRSVNMGDKKGSWPLGLLGKGRAMGWSALLYGPRYATASAICQKPSQVVSIEGASLRSVLDKEPGIGFKVMDRLACMLGERLKAAYNTMEAHL
jgi:CRP/FNR family cyclic AMP-dependent transcriptional regulator